MPLTFPKDYEKLLAWIFLNKIDYDLIATNNYSRYPENTK